MLYPINNREDLQKLNDAVCYKIKYKKLDYKTSLVNRIIMKI